MITGKSTSQAEMNANGFTLVELLVVIGIISVLITILMPSLSKARRAALAVECQSNMQQMGIGLRMYAEANQAWLPCSGEDGDEASTSLTLPDNQGWASECLWMNAVSRATVGKTYNQLQLDALAGRGRVPMEGDHHVLVCPAAPGAMGSLTSTDGDPVVNGYFMMWGNNASGTPEQRQTFVCYAWNYKLFGGSANATSSPGSIPSGGWAPMGKITQISHPSETCVIFEKRTSISEVTAGDDAYYASFFSPAKTNQILGSPVGRFRGDWRRFSSRHDGSGFVLFADGHVGEFKMRAVLTPTTVASGSYDWNHYNQLIWNCQALAK